MNDPTEMEKFIDTAVYNRDLFGDFAISLCLVCGKRALISAIYVGALECTQCASFYEMRDKKIVWNAEVCMLGVKEKGYLIVYHRDHWEEIA
jgi:hypothetical protein